MTTATKTRSKVKTPNEKLMEMSETRSNIASYTIKGATPYLQHCDLLANPMQPMQEIYKTLTGKKKKTREDHLNRGQVQFEAAIYYGEKGPYVPSTHIHAALRNAARKDRQGKIVEESLVDEIFTNPQHDYTKSLLNSIPKGGKERLQVSGIGDHEST